MKCLQTILKKLARQEKDPKDLLGENFNLNIRGKILHGTVYTDNQIDYEFLFQDKNEGVGSVCLPLVNPVYFRKGKSCFVFPKKVSLGFCNYNSSGDFLLGGYKSRKIFLDKAFSRPPFSNY
jgi:hypothetical protein